MARPCQSSGATPGISPSARYWPSRPGTRCAAPRNADPAHPAPQSSVETAPTAAGRRSRRWRNRRRGRSKRDGLRADDSEVCVCSTARPEAGLRRPGARLQRVRRVHEATACGARPVRCVASSRSASACRDVCPPGRPDRCGIDGASSPRTMANARVPRARRTGRERHELSVDDRADAGKRFGHLRRLPTTARGRCASMSTSPTLIRPGCTEAPNMTPGALRASARPERGRPRGNAASMRSIRTR